MNFNTDVLVIGAGASGIPAAIAAARTGAKVILLEEDTSPGGAPIDQFVLMPDGGPRVGICAELMEILETRYALTQKKVDKWYYFWYLPGDYQLAVNELIRKEKNLTLISGNRPTDVIIENNCIKGIILKNSDLSETRITAEVVIDATGSAEIANMAGCETHYGRESRNEFDEKPAPEIADDQVQLCTWQYITQRLSRTEPFDFSHLENCKTGLKSGLQEVRFDEDFAKSDDGCAYLHWGCKVRCSDTRDPVQLAKTQNEVLSMIAPDVDLLRQNGFAVYLAPKIGVRESRRLVGEYVINFNDLTNGVIPDDSIMLTNRDADIWTEGKTQLDYPPAQVYGIPYRSILPKSVDNLLVVGKSISGTHLAMSAYRVQCILAGVGQAAGVAAGLCVQKNCAPRSLDYKLIPQKMASLSQHASMDDMKRQLY